MEREDIKKEMDCLGWELFHENLSVPDKSDPGCRRFMLSFKTKEEHSCPGCGLPHRGHIGSFELLRDCPSVHQTGVNEERKTKAWFKALELMRDYPQEATP